MSQQPIDKENNKEYKYDAFISYRHTELDKYVAEKIHKYLEEFKLPKNVKNKKAIKKTRIERVFRDKEELTITNNLEDPIIQALKQSEYLIVICSPNLRESVWCRKEIETFIEFHGRNRILTVLIDGEPEESFPEELLFDEEIVKENGADVIHRKNVEPLAADIRGKSKRQMCALLKTELLRIIAPIFGLEYDDLRQRHRERKIKRIMTATASAAALGIAVGVAGIASALIISKQKDEIQKQNSEITSQKEFIESQNEMLLLHQAENLAKMSLENLSQDRRIDAINMAISSITEFQGMKMPYTASGRLALIKALRVYDMGNAIKAQNQFVADTNISFVQLSESRKYILARDKNNDAYIWDVVTGELITKITDLDWSAFISYVGDTMLVYRNNNNQIRVIDFLEGKDLFVIDDAEDVIDAITDNMGKYVGVLRRNKINVYDTKNGEIIYEVENKNGDIVDKNFVLCGNKLLYFDNDYPLQESEKQNINTIKIVDLQSGNIIEISGKYDRFEGGQVEDGCIFITANHYDGSNAYEIVFAVEESSGLVLWKNEYIGTSVRKIKVIEIEGKLMVVTTGYNNLICINGKTGEEYYNNSVVDEISDFVVSSDGCVQVTNAMGKIFEVNIFSKELYSLEHYFECNIEQFHNAGICEGGYFVLPMESNSIIKYEKAVNQDKQNFTADEEMIKDMEELWNPPNVSIEELKKIGVMNPELVQNILYIDDNTAIVSYLGSKIDIYDLVNKNVINTINDIRSTPVKYYGNDEDGNIYIAGISHGYIIDKDYNLVAEIEEMKYADVDNKYLIVRDDEGELWQLPIYSYEDLIAKAKAEVAEKNIK